MIFSDESYLDVSESVQVEHGRSIPGPYRYHYQRPEGAVFTYDDTPHHQELGTFPYHKHLYRSNKRSVQASPRVSLADVIKEALRLLSLS